MVDMGNSCSSSCIVSLDFLINYVMLIKFFFNNIKKILNLVDNQDLFLNFKSSFL